MWAFSLDKVATKSNKNIYSWHLLNQEVGKLCLGVRKMSSSSFFMSCAVRSTAWGA